MGLRVIFNGVPAVNDHIVFHYDPNYPALPSLDFSRGNVFKNSRVNPGEVTRGTDGLSQAANYYTAFLLDYGVSFNVMLIGNTVEIEANNESELFNYSCESGLVAFELFTSGVSDNEIHEINFTPKSYTASSQLKRDYLITEDDYFIITEDNKKIRL